MGICFLAFSASDKTIEAVLDDPLLVWQVVDHDHPDVYRKAVEEANRQPFFKRLWGKTSPPVKPAQLTFGEHELCMADLDKSWDGLNFIFRTLWPGRSSFFEDAAEIGKLEVGLGPALYHSSQAMAAFAKALEPVSEQQLLAAFYKTDMSKAYLHQFWVRKDPDVVFYLTENFNALKAFVAYTARHSLGAILQFG